MSALKHAALSEDATLPEGDDAVLVPPRRPVVRYLALNRLSGVYTWAVLVVLFGIWVPSTFLTSATISSIGANTAVTAMVALALIIPLAGGLFDLSVAATLGVCAVLTLYLQAHGMSVGLSILVSLATGAAIGVINGLLVVGVGINSFIATLGMSSVLAAFAYWITGGNQLVASVGSHYVKLGQGTLLGLPDPIWYAAAIALVLFYFTEWTTVGHYLYGIGGNIEAARLVGIRVDRILFGSLVSSGVIAAFAGIVLSAQLGSSSADIGPRYLLPAFSAVLLGATQIKTNGRVNVLGTLVAVILLATGIYGLQLAGAPSFISDLFNGVALIVAVSLSLRANRKT
jgi:ribose transport system permease protein